MKILLVEESTFRIDLLTRGLAAVPGAQVTPVVFQGHLDVDALAAEVSAALGGQEATLLVPACPIPGRRVEALGLRLVERLRAVHRALNPVLTWSIQKQESLRIQHPFLGLEDTGLAYLELPSLAKFAEVLPIDPLSPEQLPDVVASCRSLLDDVYGKLFHDLARRLGREDLDGARAILQEVERNLELHFRGDLKGTIQELLKDLDKVDASELVRRSHEAQDLVLASFGSPPRLATGPPDDEEVPDKALDGFWHVLVADDEPEGLLRDMMTDLEAIGYGPVEHAECLQEALDFLDAESPDILLSDYNLDEDPANGLLLMRRAVEDGVKVVIAISGNPRLLERADLPEGVEICQGNKFSASDIHASICRAVRRLPDGR